jgi:MFS transporter, SHS family, lactate transporter
LAWTCDAIDFFCVSLSVANLEAEFNRSAHDITTAITLTLLFRSLGAVRVIIKILFKTCTLKILQVVFGIISDRFGRKWPLVVNLVMCSILQLGTGFIQTFHQLLVIRSLFGIAMGGIWGLAAATALENLPVELRGLGGGIIQQGYAVGCMLATTINLTLVPETSTGWRSLFWCAAGISLLAAFIRAFLPESAVFLRVKEIEKGRGTTAMNKTTLFLRETKTMLGRHWLLCIYAVVLMTGGFPIKLGLE